MWFLKPYFNLSKSAQNHFFVISSTIFDVKTLNFGQKCFYIHSCCSWSAVANASKAWSICLMASFYFFPIFTPRVFRFRFSSIKFFEFSLWNFLNFNFCNFFVLWGLKIREDGDGNQKLGWKVINSIITMGG